MKPYAFGIDLGGTTCKIGFFNTQGEVLDKWEIPTRKEEDGKYILPDIAASIKEKMAEKGVDIDQVWAAGIGVPGPALENGTVNECVNLGWGVTPVNIILSELLGGIPVAVANDANAAALGELWKGGARGYKDIVMVTLGTGVGGGIILNSQIVHGTYGAAGEIGHMMMSTTETEQCKCGKCGCLEQYCSASGIVRMARIKLATVTRPSILREKDDVTLTAKDVFDAAKAEDPLALELIEEFGMTLGRALSLISSVVDPQAIVIGGGVSKAGKILIDVVEKYYRKYVFLGSRDTKFVLATLGNDAGMYGAVKMVL